MCVITYLYVRDRRGRVYIYNIYMSVFLCVSVCDRVFVSECMCM